MNLEDLYKLAGVVKSTEPAEVQADTPVQEQPINPREDMKAFIALVTPEQLNKLTGEAPVEEEGFANSGDEYAGEPEEYKGPLGSPADLSLRRYLDANGQPVHVEENVYPDHKVEDITEAWNEYKIDEKKAKPDYIDIDGDGDKKESMKKAAKDKEEKEQADESVEENQDITDLKKLSGIAEAPFPGEYDYTDPKYMDADGTPKVDVGTTSGIEDKHYPITYTADISYDDRGRIEVDNIVIHDKNDEMLPPDHPVYQAEEGFIRDEVARTGEEEGEVVGEGKVVDEMELAEINDLRKLAGI